MGRGDLVRQPERHAGVIGEGEKRRAEHSAAGKDRADAAGGELLDRVVAEVRQVENVGADGRGEHKRSGSGNDELDD